jgi:uncharacterized protein (TIGR03382 family)
MKYTFALVTAAGLASSAFAQSGTSQLVFETSLDGTTWAGGTRDIVVGATPTRVEVRVRAVLQNPSGIIGFAGLTFQPTLTNWTAADSRVAFTTSDGSGTTNAPGNFGRIFPFSGSGMRSDSASGLLTSFVDGGNTLRFAGANAVTATTNRAWGVASNQLTQNIAGTNFAPGTDVVIFKYGVDISGSAERTLVASVPLDNINLTRMTWYTTPAGGSFQAPMTQAQVINAGIHVVPTPASLALLGLGGLVIGRRRR